MVSELWSQDFETFPEGQIFQMLIRCFCRAVNNELLDTYQLKSLDGLVEGGLEDIAIVRRHDDHGADHLSPPGRRKRPRRTKTGPRQMEGEEEKEAAEKKKKKKKEGGQLYLTLAELLDNQEVRNGSGVAAAHLPAYHYDNFSLRQPYDRVITCLGFTFNFTIFDG